MNSLTSDLIRDEINTYIRNEPVLSLGIKSCGMTFDTLYVYDKSNPFVRLEVYSKDDVTQCYHMDITDNTRKSDVMKFLKECLLNNFR